MLAWRTGSSCAGRRNRSRCDRYRFAVGVRARRGTPSFGWVRNATFRMRHRAAQSVADQPVFETSVALARYVGLSRGKVRPKKVARSGPEPSHHLSGTDGSNPASSSGESGNRQSLSGGRWLNPPSTKSPAITCSRRCARLAKELDLKSPFETNQPVSLDYMNGIKEPAPAAAECSATTAVRRVDPLVLGGHVRTPCCARFANTYPIGGPEGHRATSDLGPPYVSLARS